jgi:hypothetical protein
VRASEPTPRERGATRGTNMRLRALPLAFAVLFGSACVSNLPLKEQAPTVSFETPAQLVVSVVDQRHWLQKGKRNTFIGRAHGDFGIPTDMHVHPYFVAGWKNRNQSLASALEERIVLGFAGDGGRATAAGSIGPLSAEEMRAVLAKEPGSELLVVTLREWFVSLNLGRITPGAFNFDWAVDIEVLSANGSSMKYSAKGRDVIDVDYAQSYQNLIRLAYRERLTKLLEEPVVRAALEGSTASAGADSRGN